MLLNNRFKRKTISNLIILWLKLILKYLFKLWAYIYLIEINYMIGHLDLWEILNVMNFLTFLIIANLITFRAMFYV